MKIVVAMDSFKGCLSSAEAGEAVRRGAARACPEA
ncbi:MAG: glycerate kinase, partial [Oscillospiraceae bacterium]|nr:glycerate kinase [Oscillospiraceae bacterium]